MFSAERWEMSRFHRNEQKLRKESARTIAAGTRIMISFTNLNKKLGELARVYANNILFFGWPTFNQNLCIFLIYSAYEPSGPSVPELMPVSVAWSD